MAYYHYTSIEAFYNIIKSQAVWMSCISSMNDEEEGLDGLRVMEKHLGIKITPNDESILIGKMSSSCRHLLNWDYCFSASSLKDDISQWRAYTPLGEGICIEFSDGFLDTPYLYKQVCIYDQDEKTSYIENDEFLSLGVDEIKEKNPYYDDREWCDTYIKRFTEAVSKFKNNSFRAEAETRWVVSPEGGVRSL